MATSSFDVPNDFEREAPIIEAKGHFADVATRPRNVK
jgi:hypothetical protein